MYHFTMSIFLVIKMFSWGGTTWGLVELNFWQSSSWTRLEIWSSWRKLYPALCPWLPGSGIFPLMCPPVWSIHWRLWGTGQTGCSCSSFQLEFPAWAASCWAGSLWPFMDTCAAPKEDFYSTGAQTEARVADLTWYHQSQRYSSGFQLRCCWIVGTGWEWDTHRQQVLQAWADGVVSTGSWAVAHKLSEGTKASAARSGTLLSRWLWVQTEFPLGRSPVLLPLSSRTPCFFSFNYFSFIGNSHHSE